MKNFILYMQSNLLERERAIYFDEVFAIVVSDTYSYLKQIFLSLINEIRNYSFEHEILLV